MLSKLRKAVAAVTLAAVSMTVIPAGAVAAPTTPAAPNLGIEVRRMDTVDP